MNQTVTAGQTATFSVVAGGTAPLSYQWQKNGANISGATLPSYTTPVTDGATQLPVAAERSEHRGSDAAELHHDGDDDGQRVEFRCGGEQHGGKCDE